MSNENALLKYSNAVAALKDHIKDNKTIFDAHQKLVYAVMDAENELRDAVAETKEGVKNETHIVTVTPVTITQVDPDDVRARQGQALTPEVIGEIIKTIERPPRIVISEVKAE